MRIGVRETPRPAVRERVRFGSDPPNHPGERAGEL